MGRVDADLNTYYKRIDNQDAAYENFIASIEGEMDEVFDILNSIKTRSKNVDGYDFSELILQYIEDSL
jgi:hypothetical protein